jgi:Bacterial PH domain
VGVLSVAGIVWAIQRHDPRWIFLSLPFTLMVFVLGRYAPTAYRLGADGVHIDRRAGPVLIPYRRIRGADREARPVAGVSVFGSQGVFGRFGRFWNMRLGVYRLFLTNRDTIVWLATDDGWVGLSPDRPDDFIARLRARLDRAR